MYSTTTVARVSDGALLRRSEDTLNETVLRPPTPKRERAIIKKSKVSLVLLERLKSTVHSQGAFLQEPSLQRLGPVYSTVYRKQKLTNMRCALFFIASFVTAVAHEHHPHLRNEDHRHLVGMAPPGRCGTREPTQVKNKEC